MNLKGFKIGFIGYFCIKCKQDLPLSEFYIRRKGKDEGKIHQPCKQCEKLRYHFFRCSMCNLVKSDIEKVKTTGLCRSCNTLQAKEKIKVKQKDKIKQKNLEHLINVMKKRKRKHSV